MLSILYEIEPESGGTVTVVVDGSQDNNSSGKNKIDRYFMVYIFSGYCFTD